MRQFNGETVLLKEKCRSATQLVVEVCSKLQGYDSGRRGVNYRRETLCKGSNDRARHEDLHKCSRVNIVRCAVPLKRPRQVTPGSDKVSSILIFKHRTSRQLDKRRVVCPFATTGNRPLSVDDFVHFFHVYRCRQFSRQVAANLGVLKRQVTCPLTGCTRTMPCGEGCCLVKEKQLRIVS